MSRLFSILYRVFVEDITAKVVCFGLAMLVWVYVSDQYTTSRQNVTFDLQFDTGGEVAASSKVRRVSVTLKGPQGKIEQVLAGERVLTYAMHVDPKEIQDTRVMTRTIRLTAGNFNLPGGVMVSAISPAELAVTLGTEPSRYVPVVPFIQHGDQAKYPFDVTVSPSEIQVFGPWEAISRLTLVKTEPVDLKGRELDFSRKVKILETLGSSTIRTNDTIKIDIHFNQKQLRIVRKDLSVQLLMPPDFPFDVEAPPLSLDVACLVTKKQFKDTDDGKGLYLQPVVNLSGVKKAGQIVLPIQILKSSDMVITSQSIKQVSLTVKARQAKELKKNE